MAFPYIVKLVRPDNREDYAEFVIKHREMSVWCQTVIVDHWGEDSNGFCFSFEKDFIKFKDKFNY